MTRINLGVAPYELCDQHLIAEYRELPRVRHVLMDRVYAGKATADDIPQKFCLGTGHVLYFINRGKFLKRRFFALLQEMRLRGFATNFETWQGFPEQFCLDCGRTDDYFRGREMVRARICERLITMKREPTWTKCSNPWWTVTAMGERHAEVS